MPQKLGLKPMCRLGLAKPPENFSATLGPLPDGVEVSDATRAKGPFDVIVCFAATEDQLASAFGRMATKLAPAGGLWVAWPKKKKTKSKASKPPETAAVLDENVVRRTGLDTGRLVDNKVCAIDETWSGLRFVVRLSHR